MVSIHAHEEGRERWLPADFLPTFAHAVIDAGADIMVGHGPHLLRGLEFYKGKPIFYSLGNFIFEYETMERIAADDYDTLKRDPTWTPGQVSADIHRNLEQSFPADDRYWETVLPICEFEGDHVEEITLYPLTLGFKQPVWERGIPRLASGEQAEATLRRFAALSAPFGTDIDITDGVGHVRIPGGIVPSGEGLTAGCYESRCHSVATREESAKLIVSGCRGHRTKRDIACEHRRPDRCEE